MRLREIGWLAVIALPLLLAGCVESNTDAFAGIASATPLPDKFLAKSSTDTYVLERHGDYYQFVGGDTFDHLKLFSSGQDQYVLQISSKEAEGGFTYSIGTLTPGQLELVEAQHGNVAAKLGFSKEATDPDTATLEDADQITNVLQAGVTDQSASTNPYQIFDYAVPAQRAQAKDILKHKN